MPNYSATSTNSPQLSPGAAPKPRLLFVVHSLQIGGAELLVLQLAAEVEHLYTIGICCLDSRGALWERAAERGYHLFECFRAPGWHLRNFTALARVLAQFKPDLIHAHQYTPFFFSSIGKLCSLSSARLILTEHGRFVPDLVSRKRRLVNQVLIKTVSAVTAVSEFSKRALIEKEGFTKTPISVIYNGIPPVHPPKKSSSLAAELKLPQATKFIGFVGTLRAVKNPEFLLEAYASIAERQPDTALVFIGDGPLRPTLERRIQELKLTERVFLLGQKNPASAYYSQFAVFVLPSLSEAASLALLEAMVNGIPTIVTDGGGSPELVGYGEAGIVVRSGNVEELANALVRVLSSESEQQRLSENAKQRVHERFSYGTMIRSYSELYETLR